MCIADAIQFDTGFLDSRAHFGINTKTDNIEYRRVMTCAPVTTDGYVSPYVDFADLNSTDDAGWISHPSERYLKYSSGLDSLFNDNTTFAWAEYTWDISFGFWSEIAIYKLE
jgi:hypothetical protein